MVISALRTWWRVARALRTPLVVSLDHWYYTMSMPDWRSQVANYLAELFMQPYLAELFDCDDFALCLKAAFSKSKVNGIGLVYGRYNRRWHWWNVVLDSGGLVLQLEPQTGVFFFRKRDYRPLLVVM